MDCIEKCIPEAYLMRANQMEKAIEVMSYAGSGRSPMPAK